MPRNSVKDLQQREERKKWILESASRVFSKNGMLTKIGEIAKEAGLSHGHIYNYFASKEEILLTLIKQSQDAYHGILVEAQNQPGSGLDKLRYVVERIMPFGKEADHYLVLLQAQSSNVLSEADKSVIQQRARGNLEILVEIIEQGQREEIVMQGDSRQLATLFATLIQNLILLEIRGFEAAKEKTIDLVMKMISAKK